MNWADECEQECAFLREQLAQADRKIAHIEKALSSCHDCLETDGLKAMRHTAQIERDLLADLLDHCQGDHVIPLEIHLVSQINRCHQEALDLSHGWQRGHPTPPGYWEAESKHAFLTRLLSAYHAWRAGRPYYPEVKPGADG